MNVKVQYTLDFSAITVEENQLKPAGYSIQLNLLTLTEENKYNNIAVERISFFVQNILNGSIFCAANNPIVKKLKAFGGNNIILLPENPYDQLIATILFHKLHAIMEDKMEIDNIVINNVIASKFGYTIDDFSEFDGDQESWWDKADLSTTTNKKECKLFPSWEEAKLSWDAQLMSVDDSEEILFEFEKGSEHDVKVVDGGVETNE